ncbi:uncharacterized protein LOC133184861 [Saccostrea echinata]|uniref:uncharacterized protein LOC133184861 n=1 Tax=Saccostrea echinata TaxID=191078 RepID=UPI002A7EF453|nr:uncharacterized protein LOC133184861 [Saccostrea echinata]
MNRYSVEDVLRLLQQNTRPHSGTRAEGTGATERPFFLLSLFSPNSFPRQQRNKLEDKYDKDEFDNGYSAKISEISSNNADNSLLNSQLIEKTSIRSERLLDSIWFKDQENSKIKEEEEIRNVFRNEDEEEEDLEVDGDNSYISNQASMCPCNSKDCPVNLLLMGNPKKLKCISQTNNRKKEIKLNALAQESESSAENSEKSSQTQSFDATAIHQIKPQSSNICTNEKTPDTILTETAEQLENEEPMNDDKISQINEPDPNRDLRNDKMITQPISDAIGYEVEKDKHKDTNSTENTPSMTNLPTSEEIHIKDDSEGAVEDDVDDIDDVLLDEDEFDEIYDYYTFDNILPENIPGSVKKVFSAGGVRGKEGRYSKGISQYANLPTFMESIWKFASDNGFELEDVIPDGNCMFRAVVDQLNVNGDFGYTPQSLRLKAVRFLRKNPCQSDGSRLEAFLSTETWEQYLLRMEQNSQWGDHMILKAIADALNLIVIVFNVFEDDIRRTEILPEGTPITKRQRLTIYLGHIGEFHYLSLREYDWEIYWPFKSLIRRYQVFRKMSSPLSTKKDILEKIENMGIEKFLQRAGLKIPHQEETLEQLTNSLPESVDLLPEKNRTFVKYGLANLQLQENKESLESLLVQGQGIDPLTGLPLPHFSYIINYLLDFQQITSVVRVFKQDLFKEGTFPGFKSQMHGASVEDVNVCMVDCTKEKKMQYYEDVKSLNFATIVMCNMNFNVIYLDDANTDKTLLTLSADCKNTHAGYCRLIPAFPLDDVLSSLLYRRNSEVYLKKTPSPPSVQGELGSCESKKILYGYHCNCFPKLARRWHSRQRKCKWPSDDIIEEILSGGCTLIQRAHPESVLPEVEWKFVFSNADQILLKKALCPVQKSVFRLFKISVEYLTRHLDKTLKHKHLKNVFFHASENIRREVWEQNVGGCLLFIVGYLLDCLKNRNIPHYFIPENNLIDYYSEKEIQTIATYIEAFRVLPIQCLQNMYNRHGWKHVFKPALGVLKDCKHFSETRDIHHAWLNVFHPTSMKAVTGFASFGLYEAAYQYICEAYDKLNQALLSETPSFEQVFQDALKYVKTSASREALEKLHNEKCGRCSPNNKQNSRDHKPMNISDVMPFKVDERIRDLKIPGTHSKVPELITKWMDSKARKYYMGGNFEMAEVLLQTDIKYIKHLLKEQNDFDISEIEDKNLRSEIGQQRTERTTSLLSILFDEYRNLFIVCGGLGSIRSFDEHMADLEEFEHSVEGAGILLESIRAFPGRPHPSLYFPSSRESSLSSTFLMCDRTDVLNHMAYDELFGLPKSSRHVIPRMMDSTDNNQFTPGYCSLPTSLREMTISHSNSVVQMIEKRRNQSHYTFAGIWKTEQRIEENTSEKEEEIKNNFSCSEDDFDLGFDSNIMKDHSKIWRNEASEHNIERKLEFDGLESNYDKQHTPDVIELQSNLHVRFTEQGNSTAESGDVVLKITEVSGDTHYQSGHSCNSYGDSGKSSSCTDPNLDCVSSTTDGTLTESGTYNIVSRTGKNLEINKERGSEFKSNISLSIDISDKHSRESKAESTSDGVHSLSTMKAESTEENCDKDTKKTLPDKNEQNVHVTVNKTPSSGGTEKSQDKEMKVTKSMESPKSTNNSNERIFAAERSQGSQDGDSYWDFSNNSLTNKTLGGSNYNKQYGSKKTGNTWGNSCYDYSRFNFYEYIPTTTYFTYHTRAMEDFAEANDIELHDVEADGNCMFRAVEDQMRINAEFGQTAKSLRLRAVKYLRQNPEQEDGSHLRNFLSTKETWEQYLCRMERNSSWGDHLTLKAISEAFGTTIVVFNIGKDIRRTELVPTAPGKSSDTQFFLGHIGEYHYLSLRPKTWEKTWPKRAQLYREKWSYHQLLTKYIEAKLDNIELKRKIANYENVVMQNKTMLSILSPQGDINDNETEPTPAVPVNDLPNGSTDKEISEDEETRLNEQLSRIQTLVEELPVGFVYKGWFTNEKNYHYLLVVDPLFIDPECGVPLPHLSFILRFWMKDSIQLPVNIAFPGTSKPVPDNCVIEFAGSSCDASNAYLPDRTENGASNMSSRFPRVPMKIFCRKDIIVKFKTNEEKKEKEVFVDESQTHPGYCRLRPSVESNDLWGSQLFYIENDCFVEQSDPIDSSDLREYHGFQSHEWIPSRTDWATRSRPSMWPSDELREKIQNAGVIFINRPHASSQAPNVEWQIIFSKAEKEIFLNVLSPCQKQNYDIFKVLVDYQTKHCKFRLTPSHIKAVFLRAMECVPLTSWENNNGGCLLYLLNLLSTFLDKGDIPHYFISENNMIDHVPVESLQELKLHVDTIRHFPIEVLKFCFEKHGIIGTGLSKVLDDLDRYRMSPDIFWTVENVFLVVVEMWTANCKDHYNFNRALDLIYQAYLVNQDMVQPCSTSNTDNLEAFVSKALARWSDVERYKLFRMFDDMYHTKLSSMNLTEDTVFIKSLLEEEIESEFCNMPIPVHSVGNKGQEAKLLEDIATTCNFLKKDEESLVFIKTAISLLKKALHEDILDVSEVEDATLKQEIGRKNYKLTTSLNTSLAGCYQKLSTCCVASQQQEMMHQYMPEIEALAERMPKMLSFVEKMWTQLGQAEKGREFKKKHGGFQKNNWGQNEFYDDDID